MMGARLNLIRVQDEIWRLTPVIIPSWTGIRWTFGLESAPFGMTSGIERPGIICHCDLYWRCTLVLHGPEARISNPRN